MCFFFFFFFFFLGGGGGVLTAFSFFFSHQCISHRAIRASLGPYCYSRVIFLKKSITSCDFEWGSGPPPPLDQPMSYRSFLSPVSLCLIPALTMSWSLICGYHSLCADPESFFSGCSTKVWQRFFSWWGERRPKYHLKRAIIGPQATGR